MKCFLKTVMEYRRLSDNQSGMSAQPDQGGQSQLLRRHSLFSIYLNEYILVMETKTFKIYVVACRLKFHMAK